MVFWCIVVALGCLMVSSWFRSWFAMDYSSIGHFITAATCFFVLLAMFLTRYFL